MCDMATATLRTLPPPADGVLYLIGDSTLKDKRGRKHPLGHTTRHSEHDPYTFGFEMVLLIASWGRLRVPMALATIDPQIKGHQNILFRQMLKDFVPPAWVAAGRGGRRCGFCRQRDPAADHRATTIRMSLPCPGHGNLRMANICGIWSNICPRAVTIAGRATNPMDVGGITGSLRAVPRSTISVMSRSYLSKKRRNDGPKNVKIIVTNLTEASAGAILSMYAWRWGVEVTIKELKSGLHLGQMQVTNDKERVTRSVALSVLAYLLLVRLYGTGRGSSRKTWSLFKLKERFIGEVAQEAVQRTERKWQRKLKQFKDVA